MARKYTFTVEGEGTFPLDMLRYDSCWPKASEDVSNIRIRNRGKRQVTLLGHRRSTRERWDSFGWPVIKETVS